VLGGVPSNDRAHVIPFIGANNQVGLIFDATYNGSDLCHMMSDLASASVGDTVISGLQPKESLPTAVAEKAGGQLALVPFRNKFGEDLYVSSDEGVYGLTLRPLRGILQADALYSVNDTTRVAFDITQPTPEASATIAHEVVHANAMAHGSETGHTGDSKSEARIRDIESAARISASN